MHISNLIFNIKVKNLFSSITTLFFHAICKYIVSGKKRRLKMTNIRKFNAHTQVCKYNSYFYFKCKDLSLVLLV